MGDARDLGGALRRGDPQLAGEFREGCGGDLYRPGRSRMAHGLALLGGSGLIRLWHGGERTGLTGLRAKRGAGAVLVPGIGGDRCHGWFLVARYGIGSIRAGR
ncbi:hypothetical protein GCM10018772_67940 [Streptomyces fumanus]|uniref:Uncharacterized protein n=1 Tax=Streptomyces fumanus TaxID=67302 RepID=A0A919AYQ7_9ACTN|nr:hypothetical protein GCM10018772_67940 [Streptomyces fumanus]